ncbi:hypothetical protein DAEQUDRAFT_660695 [Daedalea quercina L-15889]|uniref:RRN7-type domain-containing protein n=1 Tax=Daedalea quercina L-15889 TaxID=1314783 RepID=A0A165U3X0_9APHY|nr:hypothetical protein DAEQUDRAFT_660695 [Daedalea quercina L-15889]
MAPRRRCPICGSKQWHKEPSSGLITCSEGHVLQNYRNETREVTELGPHALKKRALKSTRKKKERESRADPRLYHGERARYHYFQCLQLILRMQVAALTKLWELPPEFEIVCRDVWALHLSLVPDPPPAEPLSAVHPSADTKPDLPTGGNSSGHDESDEDAGVETAAEPGHGESSSSSGDDEDDPEMAELMRQAEETSSSSEDEGEEGAQKKVPAHRTKKKFGRKYDMPVNNLAVLVVACWTLRLPVTYMDFVRLIEAYDLPYLDPLRLLPESLIIHLTKHTKRALSPEHAPAIISLHGLASRLAKLIYSTYQVQTPEMNAAPILWRAVRALCGTPTLYVLTKKVARVLSVPLTLHRTLSSPLHRVKKKDPIWHKYDSAVPEVSLIATVIIVLKMVYGLDGSSRLPDERNDPACSLPRIDELLDHIKRLDEMAEEHHRFSANSQMSIQYMEDDTLDDYLAFCEKALLPLGDRTIERNAAVDFFPLDLKKQETQKDMHQPPMAELATMQATLLVDEDEEDDSLRPGEKFIIYNTLDSLGTLPQQYDAVIKRAAHWCGVHDDYVASVAERFERRLLRWWARRTERVDKSEADESQNEDEDES